MPEVQWRVAATQDGTPLLSGTAPVTDATWAQQVTLPTALVDGGPWWLGRRGVDDAGNAEAWRWTEHSLEGASPVPTPPAPVFTLDGAPEVSSTGVTQTFTTDVPCDRETWVGASPDEMVKQSYVARGRTEHQVVLDGYAPGTELFWQWRITAVDADTGQPTSALAVTSEVFSATTTGTTPDPAPSGTATWSWATGLTPAMSSGATATVSPLTATGCTATTTAPGDFSYADRVMQVSPGSGATSAATAAGSYTEFTITPAAGHSAQYAPVLAFSAARGGSATPRGWAVTTSADGHASVLASSDITSQRAALTPYSVTLPKVAGPLTVRVRWYSPATTSTIEVGAGMTLTLPSTTTTPTSPTTSTLAAVDRSMYPGGTLDQSGYTLPPAVDSSGRLLSPAEGGWPVMYWVPPNSTFEAPGGERVHRERFLSLAATEYYVIRCPEKFVNVPRGLNVNGGLGRIFVGLDIEHSRWMGRTDMVWSNSTSEADGAQLPGPRPGQTSVVAANGTKPSGRAAPNDENRAILVNGNATSTGKRTFTAFEGTHFHGGWVFEGLNYNRRSDGDDTLVVAHHYHDRVSVAYSDGSNKSGGDSIQMFDNGHPKRLYLANVTVAATCIQGIFSKYVSGWPPYQVCSWKDVIVRGETTPGWGYGDGLLWQQVPVTGTRVVQNVRGWPSAARRAAADGGRGATVYGGSLLAEVQIADGPDTTDPAQLGVAYRP